MSWTEVAAPSPRAQGMLWREPLLVVMAFAAGMMILATSQHIKGHAKNADNAMPPMPKEALKNAQSAGSSGLNLTGSCHRILCVQDQVPIRAPFAIMERVAEMWQQTARSWRLGRDTVT